MGLGSLSFFVEILEGRGGYQFLTKLIWKIQGGEGVLSEILSVAGYGYFLEPHNTNPAERRNIIITTDSVIGNTVELRLSRPRLSGLFLWSQFGHEYLLVTIKIHSHILFKTTALKSAVKSKAFCSQTAKTVHGRVVTNEEHSDEF